MAARNGSPELVLRTIGGCMAYSENEAIELLRGRVNSRITCVKGDVIVTTHDGHLIKLSGYSGGVTAEVIYKQEEVD